MDEASWHIPASRLAVVFVLLMYSLACMVLATVRFSLVVSIALWLLMTGMALYEGFRIGLFGARRFRIRYTKDSWWLSVDDVWLAGELNLEHLSPLCMVLHWRPTTQGESSRYIMVWRDVLTRERWRALRACLSW